jgi:hypothetical protein
LPIVDRHQTPERKLAGGDIIHGGKTLVGKLSGAKSLIAAKSVTN